jgi:glycerol-3-phosphate dehydrogenase (NAD+)
MVFIVLFEEFLIHLSVITTCYGGRNRKVAEEFVKSGKPFEQLEVEMLNGQKLQGTLTAEEVYQVLLKNNLVGEFPLFVKTYRVIFEAAPPSSLVDGL